MLPYWLVFVCLVLGAIFQTEGTVRKITPVLFAFSILLTVMIGFRYRVGGDWGTYSRLFNFIRGLDLGAALQVANSDPGYSLANWVPGQLGMGVWGANLICGSLLMWGIMSLVVRQPNPWLVLVVAFPYLIVVVGMGYTRQSAAIGLAMVAMVAAAEQRLIKFLVLIVAATAFHKTAIIMLPIMGLVMSKNRTMTAALVLPTAYLLYSLFVSDRLDRLTHNYVQEKLESSGALQRLGLNALPAVIFLLVQSRFGFADAERRLWRNTSISAVVMLGALAVSPSSTVLDRLGLYFIPLQLVIFGRLPIAMGRQGIGQIAINFLVISLYAAALFVWLNYAVNARGWIPYRLSAW